MRLGVNIGYMGAGYAANGLELACEADRLGYDVCWVAEAFGSDAATVISWVASRTRRIAVGSSVFQIPARTPAMTAMTAATLDTLSAGRFRLGLGVSGPQVSEGWHGVRFADPLGRTREYVEIVRKALRQEPLTHAGVHWTLPMPDGPGRPLVLSIRPVQPRIPIYLAAIGPKNLRLTGEIADGWLASFFAPEFAPELFGDIRTGRSSTAGDRTLSGFDVVSMTPIAVGDDVHACADAVRWYTALYLGGMGGKDNNYYNQLACRMGYAKQCAEVQERYLARDLGGAAAAVPIEYIDATSLLGPVSRIASRMRDFAAAGVTTLTVSPFGGSITERMAMLDSAMQARDLAGLRDVCA
ncbi:LLM class F420-dependent oxidoreductase [Phytohabitans sp. ZYX-F-186]|uniref:LLM class F420-dependent oxidoreductase n=1 Tax=Phytohabitans maris TaxID=3071409 RepID=A0ABU0ZHH0_9ACTN|nr:LLM class F420-dependent oxidoreductase [Phytohabitans sp. ZYX-F-186]MDQ7905946.1 LLM class F420-dependent oxidoreductase [Phytohabitans sp. ZYX-F-186]